MRLLESIQSADGQQCAIDLQNAMLSKKMKLEDLQTIQDLYFKTLDAAVDKDSFKFSCWMQAFFCPNLDVLPWLTKELGFEKEIEKILYTNFPSYMRLALLGIYNASDGLAAFMEHSKATWELPLLGLAAFMEHSKATWELPLLNTTVLVCSYPSILCNKELKAHGSAQDSPTLIPLTAAGVKVYYQYGKWNEELYAKFDQYAVNYINYGVAIYKTLRNVLLPELSLKVCSYLEYEQPAPHEKIHQSVNTGYAVNRHNILITSTACRHYPKLGLQASLEIGSEWSCIASIAENELSQVTFNSITAAADFIAVRTNMRWAKNLESKANMYSTLSNLKAGAFQAAFSSFTQSVSNAVDSMAVNTGLAPQVLGNTLFNVLFEQRANFGLHVTPELHAKLVFALSSCSPSIYIKSEEIKVVVTDVLNLTPAALRTKYGTQTKSSALTQ